jgi:UDP-N-acetylmuramate--alanine ligase
MAGAPQPPIDLSQPRRLHVVGVGGPGMSAIAIVLAEMGHVVSGSDIRERSVLDRVRAAGVDVHVGHRRELVHDRDAITWSTAIPARNIERDEADKVGVLSMHRSGMLAAICARARSIGVAGTHGKTSTTSMLMLILAEAGKRPSFVIGGDVTDMGTGAQWTGGEWLVVEADESDGTHLQLPLYGTILTNVEIGRAHV